MYKNLLWDAGILDGRKQAVSTCNSNVSLDSWSTKGRLLDFPGEDSHCQDAEYHVDDYWELDKQPLISNHLHHFSFVSCPDTIQNYCTGDNTAANHRKHARNFVDTEDWQVDPNYPTYNLHQ